MLAVSTTNLPPSGMASREFIARLTTICSIWPGSHLTRPSAVPGRITTSIRSPSRRRNILSMFAMTALMSSSRGWAACPRLNARSCLVNPAARSEAIWISSANRRSGLPGASSPRSSSL